MITARLIITFSVIAALTVVCLAQDAGPEVPDASERPVYRVILKCDAQKIDREAVKTALLGLKRVDAVDICDHDDGLEVWLPRDDKHELKHRVVKNALKGIDTEVSELNERWVDPDNHLVPLPLTLKELEAISREDYFVAGRSALYRITTSPPAGKPVITYKRVVISDVTSKTETNLSFHSREFTMNADRKVTGFDKRGNASWGASAGTKTETIATDLGKLLCNVSTSSQVVDREDGNGTKTNHGKTWSIERLNLTVKSEMEKLSDDGKKTTVVTELIEVG